MKFSQDFSDFFQLILKPLECKIYAGECVEIDESSQIEFCSP